MKTPTKGFRAQPVKAADVFDDAADVALAPSDVGGGTGGHSGGGSASPGGGGGSGGGSGSGSGSGGGGSGGGHGGGGGGGGGGGHGGGGGGPPSNKGDLYGDQYVVLRDVDPSDGGGNGEAVLDANGQHILVGSDGSPIYFVMNADGDYEIPADRLPFAQTVELERANVARAPESVMDKSLATALAKIDAAAVVDTDPAGRIVCDGVTIDSPLENLALYKYLMTAGGDSSWPAVIDHWPETLKALVGDTLDPDWDPASLLGAAFDKTTPITLDAVLYESTTLGVNSATEVNGALVVDYFDFNNGATETYNYDRVEQYENVWMQWYADTDGDPTDLELVQGTVLDAVFGNVPWQDQYIAIGADPNAFVSADAGLSGVNDFAQAADDARAVINFMHEYGAVEIAPPAPIWPTPENLVA